MARRIIVTVKPRARQAQVMGMSQSEYQVAVKEPAESGRANDALVRALAKHFGVPQSRVKSVNGHAARRKLIEVS